MDKIILKDLKIPVHIGISEEERSQETILLINLELSLDLSKPAQTDKIVDAVCYAGVHDLVSEVVQDNTASLLERLAQNIIERIFSDYSVVEHLQIEILKTQIPNSNLSACPGISIGRSREEISSKP